MNWLLVILIVVLIYLIFFRPSGIENFDQSNWNPNTKDAQQELSQFYKRPLAGVENYLVDTMTCSKNCCSDMWLDQFDGLNPDQLRQRIRDETMDDKSKYVRTNYTCADGPNGVGCPCIDNKSVSFLANRGIQGSPVELDRSMYVPIYPASDQPDTLTPAQEVQARRSSFSATRRMNDLELSRPEQSLTNLKGVPQ